MQRNPNVFKPLQKIGKNPKLNHLYLNNATFQDYLFRLEELCVNMFQWENVPDSIDVRFLELTLCEYGYAVYFNDEVMGNLALTCMVGPGLNVYRVPVNRRAYSITGYSRDLTDKDSVLIYNNYLRQPSMLTLLLYARRLYEIERTIDVNVKAQKTPVLIVCDEHERLTYENLYKNYDGNIPVIFGSKSLQPNSISVLKTDAPFNAHNLNQLKYQIWNEALTFCGIDNIGNEKRERNIESEIGANLGGVRAQRNVMLNMREEAADKINRMFGTNIKVKLKSVSEKQLYGLPGKDDDPYGNLYDGTAGTD